MAGNLVIVESPAKAKTIEKFLGADYNVVSSYGHIRDLAKKGLGINVEGGFEPTYEIPADKQKVVSALRKQAKEATRVWLASDEDREGEAIAWHLSQVLGLPADTPRIVFHEITKSAILEAVKSPRTVDMNLVDAQQARRLLDRLVGFELSPLLWKKVRPSLSAGRVQSVAVRLVVEREREIIAFASKGFYRVTAQFYRADDPTKQIFKAELSRQFDDQASALKFLEACVGADFAVENIEKKPAKRNPAPPFTTSTLQQEASRRLGMSPSRTMAVAQKLYERGLITYMRTDSVNLSSQAIAAAKDEIITVFGEKYSNPRKYTTKSASAQEAHEAIRPSYFNRHEIDGAADEQRLYELVWKRTVASQMASADIERTIVTVSVSTVKEHFTATGEVVLFDGFLKLYTETQEDTADESGENTMPHLKTKDPLAYSEITATERFTQAPARYSEASLVRALEERGIGRPSTYAPTITTITARGYVAKQNREGEKRNYSVATLKSDKISTKTASETIGKERGKLFPTDIGMLVTDYLTANFGDILDYNFTAKVEQQFDDVADGKQSWQAMLSDFYAPFHNEIDTATVSQVQRSNMVRVLGTDPKTGREVSARVGRYGPMVQIDAPEGEKPTYAKMKPDQLIETITLDEALSLFALPRHLGKLADKEVVVGTGRFGAYVRYDGKFTSLAKTDDPYTITLERCEELIKAAEEKKRPIKVFAEDAEIQLLNGRWGAYIAYKGKNYRIPKGKVAADLTYAEAQAIIRN